MRALAFAAVLLLGGLGSAAPAQTVLTPDGTVYTVAANPDLPVLELTRRSGEESESIVIPATDDLAVESDPRLAWDGVSRSLYLVWHRAAPEGDSIRVATLSADGTWSEPLTVAECNTAARLALQLELTHVAVAEDAPVPTLLHLAWWKTSAAGEQIAEYALVAFEDGLHVSTAVTDLDELAAVRGTRGEGDLEDVGDVAHPPLAMARAANPEEIDVVYGAPSTTAVTRIRIRPALIAGEARLWKPGRGSAGSLPPARLISASTDPVQSFVRNGRIVLYTPDQQFRYVIFENGEWTPARMIALDEKLTGDELLEHLRKLVETEDDPTPTTPGTNE